MKGKSKKSGPVQAGARKYPGPPLPKQHLQKPGLEADLKLKPMYDAPLLQGLGKAPRHGGADHRRRFRHRARGRGVVRARGRRRRHRLSQRAQGCRRDQGGGGEGRTRCILLSGDVADPKFCNDAVARTVQELGKLDILVNNAAFQEHVPEFEMLSDEHFDRTLKTNLYGYFYMARAAVPHMKAGSSIVMNGSVTGLLGNKNLLDYSMTKGGIHAFTRSLGDASRRARHPRQRGRARAGLDAAQSRRPAAQQDHEIRRGHADEARRRSRKRSRPPSSFSRRRAARATSPAKSCRSSGAIAGGEARDCALSRALMRQSALFSPGVKRLDEN